MNDAVLRRCDCNDGIPDGVYDELDEELGGGLYYQLSDSAGGTNIAR